MQDGEVKRKARCEDVMRMCESERMTGGMSERVG